MAIVNNNTNIKLFNKVVISTFVLYVILFLYYYGINTNSKIGDWAQYAQFLIGMEFIIFFFPLSRLRPQISSLIIFILVLFNTLIIRSLFLENHLTAFGPNPIDAYNYLNDAKKTALLSLGDTFAYLKNETQVNYQFNVDDYGMSFIARLAYIIGEDDKGYMRVMLLFNSLAILFSILVFSKLLRQMFDNQVARIGVVLFGLFTGFQMISVYGLKENFFLLFTLLSLYYSIKYISNYSSKHLALAVAFILSLCLFRFAVSAQVLVALISTILLKRSKHKGMVLFLLSLVGIGALVALNAIIVFLGGSGLDNMLIMAELRNTAKGGSMVVEYISQFIFSFTGQPAMFMGDFDFNHIGLFCVLLRNILTVFFVFGFLKTLSTFEDKYCFFLMYWILGSFMLIMAIRGSDFRYSCLYFPAFIVLTLKGYLDRFYVRFNYFIAAGVLGIVCLFIRGWNS